MRRAVAAALFLASFAVSARAKQTPADDPFRDDRYPIIDRRQESDDARTPTFDDKKAGLKKAVEMWQQLVGLPDDLPPDAQKAIKKNRKLQRRLLQAQREYRDFFRDIDRVQDGDEAALEAIGSRFTDWKERETDLMTPLAERFVHATSKGDRGRFTRQWPEEFLHSLDAALWEKHRDTLDGESPTARLRALTDELRQTETEIGPLAKYFDGKTSFDPREFTPPPSYSIPSAPRPVPSYGSQYGSVVPEVPMPAVGLQDLPPLDPNMEPFIRYMASFGACRGKPDLVRKIFQTAKFVGMDMNQTLQAMGMISQESSCNPNEYAANRYGGARGLTQIIEPTAKEIVTQLRKRGVSVPEYNNRIAYDPGYNLLLGLTEFKKDLDKYGFRDALVAYNAGPGRVGSAYLPAETLDYIPKVTDYYRNYLVAAARYQQQVRSTASN